MADILTAAVFVVFIVIGWKKGLLRSLYGIAALAASIIIAYLLYPYIKDIIAGSSFGIKICELVRTRYVEPGVLSQTLDSSDLPDYMKSMVATGRIGLENALTGFISNLVLNLISFVAVFIVTRLLICVVGRILHIISRLPVIRVFDKAGGVVFGIAESLLILYLIFAVMYAIVPLRENPAAKAYISESTLTKTMYENNPLVDMVTPRDYDNIITDQE